MSARFGNWQKLLDESTSASNASSVIAAIKSADTDLKRIKVVYDSRYLDKIGWIRSYFKKCFSTEDLKSGERAAQERAKGNACFQKKYYPAALQYYNEAVCAAPVDDGGSELALALANRSATLLHLAQHLTCLEDIGDAIVAGHPRHLRHKLLLRKAVCLHHLGKPDDAVKALDEALEAVELLDQTKQIVSFAANVKALREEIKTGGPIVCNADSNDLDSTPPPTPVHGYHPIMQQASNDLDLCFNEKQGRYILANRKIRIGDVLIVEKPFAAVLLPENYKTRCHHCFKKLNAVVPCRRCIEVRYCSRSCCDDSWRTYHSVECRHVDLLHSIGIAHLGLRVVLTAGIDYLSAERDRLTATVAPTTTDIPGTMRDGRYVNGYDAVHALLSHSDDLPADDMVHYTLTAALLLKCLVADPKVKVGGDLDLDPAYVGGLLLRHICQLVCNAHAITELITDDESTADGDGATDEFPDGEVTGRRQVRVATAIYPTASLLNHSCQPTIVSSFQNNLLVVRSATEVPPGGEILNCYGPHFKRMSFAERQRSLSEQYFFRCECVCCLQGAEADRIIAALRCAPCGGPVDPHGGVCSDCHRVTDLAGVAKTLQDATKTFADGVKLLESGAAKEARVQLSSCLATRRNVLHKHNKDLGETHDALAKCYSKLGLYSKSAKHLLRSVDIVEAIYGDTSVELAHELSKTAEVLMRCGMSHMKTLASVTDRAMRLFTACEGPDGSDVKRLEQMMFCVQMGMSGQPANR